MTSWGGVEEVGIRAFCRRRARLERLRRSLAASNCLRSIAPWSSDTRDCRSDMVEVVWVQDNAEKE